jgi:hypothetical protein
MTTVLLSVEQLTAFRDPLASKGPNEEMPVRPDGKLSQKTWSRVTQRRAAPFALTERRLYGSAGRPISSVLIGVAAG